MRVSCVLLALAVQQHALALQINGESRFAAVKIVPGSPLEMPNASIKMEENDFTYQYRSGGHTDYPSAWLATRQRVMAHQNIAHGKFHNTEVNVVDVAHGVIRHREASTFDFLNFNGIHLSSFTDEVGMKKETLREDKTWPTFVQYLRDRLTNDILEAKKPNPEFDTRLSKKTVAIIPFASANYKLAGRHGMAVAELFLDATFWSVKRQFKSVVLGACDDQDYAHLAMYPAWRRVHLSGEHCKDNSGMYLIEHAANMLKDDPEWDRFQYVYFTEGDVMLRLRQHEKMLTALNRFGTVVPHRMNLFPMPSEFPEELQLQMKEPGQHATKYGPWFHEFEPHRKHSSVNLDTARCCLSGRMQDTCQEFWWTCDRKDTKFLGGNNILNLLEAVKPDHGGVPFHLGTHGGPELCKLCVGADCPCA